MLRAGRQPDQEPQRWDDHVRVYETVFEPFTLQWARPASAALGLVPGQSVLDVGAGCGGAALALAEQGLRVTAVDASSRMLATELRGAIQAVFGEQPGAPPPAQLRYREEVDFRALFAKAGLAPPVIRTASACLNATSARWLSERIGFAPGMAAMLSGLGERAPAVRELFVQNLEMRWGSGPIGLSGVAFIGTALVP